MFRQIHLFGIVIVVVHSIGTIIFPACLNENIENNVYVSDFGQSMNENMLQCLSNRFKDMMKICDENKSLILAAAIHPCFKLTWLENEMDREYV